MKKVTKIASIIVVLSIILSVSAFAVQPYSSSYIRNDSASIIRGDNGKVVVYFSITGMSTMTQIGAKTIKLYNSDDELLKTFTYTDYENMMGSNVLIYSSTVSYSGDSSENYYAVVTFFAKNASGSDTDIYTTSIN